MACRRYLDALAEVAAGAAASPELETHLEEGCAACHAELSALRQALDRLDGELAGLMGAEPSSGLRPRIRAAVEADASRPAAWQWGSTGWLAAAATVVLGIALAAFLAGRPESSTGSRISGAAEPDGSKPPLAVESPQWVGSPVPAPVASTEAPSRPLEAQARRRATAPGVAADVQELTGRRAERSRAEVLVPPDEGAALMRLAGVLVEGRVGVGELMTTSTAPSALLPELPPIDIRPLEIAPLEPSGLSGS